MQSVKTLLTNALAKGASDIYYLPNPHGYLIRLRLPTGLVTLGQLGTRIGQQEINYLKFMAGMNVAEHRRVQLGAFYHPDSDVFLRLSSVADFRGRESLVVRLISGIPDAQGARQLLDRLMSILTQRRGMLTLADRVKQRYCTSLQLAWPPRKWCCLSRILSKLISLSFCNFRLTQKRK